MGSLITRYSLHTKRDSFVNPRTLIFQNNPLIGFRARLTAQSFRIKSLTRLNSSGSTPATSASVFARAKARYITSGFNVSAIRPEQMAHKEIRVEFEHGCPPRVKGCTAPGSEGWSEVPITGVRGKDVVVDGTMVVFR